MNVRLIYPINFNAGVYHNGEMVMNNYTAKIYMMTNSTDSNITNTAFDRIKHFMYSQIDSCIFIDEDNVEQAKKFISAGINITTLPSEPADQLIGIMLFYKLTAITENKLLIGEVEISSQMGDGLVYIHGDQENLNELIIPEWWKTSDLTHADPDLTSSEKIVTITQTSVWREVGLAWDSEDVTVNTDPGNTIVFADFKQLDETK